MVAFDQGLLKERLERISTGCRSLFALSCAERLFPSYDLYHQRTGRGDTSRMRSALDHLWDAILQDRTAIGLDGLDDYKLLAPGEETPWNPLNPVAENAVAAVMYACQCQIEEETESAVWAAVQGYEAADYIVHTVEGIDFTGSQAEAAILNNELVQGEIERQLRDVAQLETCSDDPGKLAELVKEFRKRASSEGMSLLPLLCRLSP